MGRILGTKTIEDNKVVYEIELNHEEASLLKGRTNNIYVLSEESAETKTNISKRGKNEATKYFLIPRELRKNLIFDEKVKCHKMESDNKTIFIYVVDKLSKLGKQLKCILSFMPF